MKKSINWKRLTGFIQKKTKNYIVKRTRIFHNQLLGRNDLDGVNLPRLSFLPAGRIRKKRKIGRKSPRELPGLTRVFRHQISPTRGKRMKKRMGVVFSIPLAKRKTGGSLFAHSRNLFRLELQKSSASVRSSLQRKYTSRMLPTQLSFAPPISKKGWQSYLKNKGDLFLARKKRISFSWNRLLYQLKRKRVLWGKWRTRRYHRVRRKAKKANGGRFGQQKQSTGNILKSGKGKIVKQVSNKQKYTSGVDRKKPPESYTVWRKTYLLFLEKKKKRTRKEEWRKKVGTPRKNKVNDFRKKPNRPRKKRRHRFRRINRLRPSVAARRRLRRKSRRFFVYRDQYQVISARRTYSQLKNGYILYQERKKQRAGLSEKNGWWFRSNISVFGGTVLDKNPVSFRRLLQPTPKKNQKQVIPTKGKMKLPVYRFLQTKKYVGNFLDNFYPNRVSYPVRLRTNPKMRTVTQSLEKISSRKNMKDISTSFGLQKGKAGRFPWNSLDFNRRLFSTVYSSQPSKFFARKKKINFQAGKGLKKQGVQQKSKEIQANKLSSGFSRKLKISGKQKRPVFGRVAVQKGGKSLRGTFNLVAKKSRIGLNQKKLRPRRRRRVVHKNWTFRFPRWKIYYRNLWRYEKQNEKYRWLHADLFPGRRYRWIQQAYRIRHPRKEKKNKWLQRLTFQNQSYSLRKRKSRLINRLMHYKLFSKFYGPFSSKRWANQVDRWRRINPRTTTRKSLSLSWYDHRLDITVYRIGLAPSVEVAQVLIGRGYIFVNGSQNLSTNYRVEPWDVVAVTPYAALRDNFEWYWFIRNQYRRYAYKRKKSQYKNIHPQRLAYPFGFRTRQLQELDLPRRDRIQGKEFDRLLLWKSQPW